MRKLKGSLVAVVAVIVILTSNFVTIISLADESENTLSTEQTNAIEMLNYITVLTQDINASKNSRVYMEEAYSTLINNTYPNAVDSRTLSQMTGLLDTMENYRMINVKRERLQYVFEQSQAQAIRAAIPNPMGLLSAVQSFNPVKLVASVTYMAVDSATSYNAYTNEIEQQYLQDGWALDDEESKVLHESRKGTFSYMIKMVNEYNLPGDATLTEDTVSELVKWKNNSNIIGRIQFLESSKDTYKSYGGYWLILAESYYENADYRKCINAIKTYENIGTRIFRRDYEYAKTLPLAIAAAKETYSLKEYSEAAKNWSSQIVNNTANEDWALRYFAAQTLVDLYAETKDVTYLKEAYSIVFNNVNQLMAEQKTLNENYLADIVEKTVPKSATKDEKKEIKAYNKMIKESRKVELVPIYEPLLLNCELLFAMVDELKLPKEERNRINSLLHPNDSKLFLVSSIDNQFRYDDTASVQDISDQIDISFEKGKIFLPAEYVTSTSTITVRVMDKDSYNETEITDWIIDEVSREDKNDVSSFVATYTSKTANKYDWKPEATIAIDVTCTDGSSISYHFEYKTVDNKNKWTDYAKVWEKGIVFERVK